MNLLRFYLNKLSGKPSVFDFTLLGQSVTLGIAAPREIRRAHEIEIESELVQHMRSTLRDGDTILDIGANIGLISILLANGPRGSDSQIHAFEPEPRNFRQLQNNIQINNLKARVHPHQLALGAEEGHVDLHIRGSEGEGRHSIASSKGATDVISVELTTMADFCKRQGIRPDIIKIDVEGAEGQVLAGMQGLLQYAPPADVFLEVHPKGDTDLMPDGQSIQDWMEHHGYALVWNNVRGSGEHRHYHYEGESKGEPGA
ncbi:MAG: FkbM family methyltransferase [Granulosicoccus sp.]|nr:FkbM family methyltransferase [Granulosicoccus sp.]